MEVEAEAAPLPETNPKPANPYSLLEETRTAMEEIAARMVAAKKEGRPKSELRELITQMSLLFISLRQVNRAILMEEDRVKTETERAKAPVDFTTLQLHNLLYEKNHYSNAIKACRDFTSKYPDIELVPEEEFFAKAPENIKGKAPATVPAHDLMLKRLNFELYQRKELCKMHERLEHQKKVLLEKISERKMFLSSLPTQLKSLKKASLPVQQQLGILHSKRVKQHHMADFLPKPLYIAYSQLIAQKEAFDERIEVEIVGSMKDVQAFMQEQANREHGQMANAEDNKLEEDVMEEDDDMQRRRARPKKELSKEATSDKEGINRLHPLKIMLSVLDQNEGEKPVKLLVLRFEYLVKLNVVCVGVEGADSDKNILCNLFPDDTGSDLPHQAAKLSAGDSLTFEHMGSCPYKWAQHLAGIDFLPELPPSRDVTDHESLKNGDLSADLTMYRRQNRVQTILLKIRSRKQAQMALLNQLNSLSKLEWPSLNYDKAPWAGYTPSCRIDSWTPMGSSSESSSFLAAPNGELSGDLDRRSVTQWDDVESNREDGELPVVVHVAGDANRNDKEKTPTPPPDGAETDRIDFARSLSLLSKSASSSKKDSSVNLARNLEDEMMVDSESEAEEFAGVDIETPEVDVNMEKPWQEHALSEFKLILRKRYSKDEIVKLEAKVKIGMEYPLRPPIFNLSIFPEALHGSKWQNELRAMEAEVNLHIIGIIPVAYENYVLANQIRCLGMLFDLNFGASDERRKIASVVDMRIGEPTRSIRGRDRRMAIYWKHSC